MRLIFQKIALSLMLLGCSNPPSGISTNFTRVEKRQDEIWISSKPFAVLGQPHVTQVKVEVFQRPGLQLVNTLDLSIDDDRAIPETMIYKIPKGDSHSYLIWLTPTPGPASITTFEIPAGAPQP